ncbi:probable multidrug resistance-associated protein lethal(2)03659 [Ctenocephalides felis]|uniref:probable multidrug resistance-associated protein lethal(2)03659 n=1 Tax=Ctenocephalides felis TaxID=7515 RepID=UPI000E6E40F4|nr:probable multidrug resistance-associated protein lethal(2)03659 [Ctenocephalides felis]
MIAYEHEYNDEPNPRSVANPLSVVLFWWTMPIFRKRCQREFEEYDLYRPLPQHRSQYLGDQFCTEWRYMRDRHPVSPGERMRKSRPRVWRVLARLFGLKLFLYGFLYFLVEIVRLHQPLLLGLLVQYFTEENGRNNNTVKYTYMQRVFHYHAQNQSAITRSEAYFFASGVVFCSALAVLVTHPLLMGCMHIGMKIRVATCSAIYRKVLRLSRSALSQTSAGQVVNLMSNDVNRFDTAPLFLHHVWVGPTLSFIITVFLYSDVGPSALYGILLILLLMPLQIFLAYTTSILRHRTARLTDERVRIMSEVLRSIDVIKMYTWEPPFQRLVHDLRNSEMKQIRGCGYIRGIVMSFIMFGTRCAIFVTLVSYVLFEYGHLTAEKVFMVIAYYNILRTAMTVYFVQGVAQVAELCVALQRIQSFMDHSENIITDETKMPKPSLSTLAVLNENRFLPQREPVLEVELSTKVKLRSRIPSEEDMAPGIFLLHAFAKWRNEDPKYDLRDLTLTLRPGTLCAVTGPVGSGKTSLLYLLLRELPVLSGFARINGAMSYASQEPWLFVGTVRQNILFGQEYERRRYRAAVAACALERDFELLPNGDHSIVGERGVSLSGGQRARVNLARAVYRKADIYLLDDPLSAVDAKVGLQLFRNCVTGFLRDKTVILVTHQLQYLQNVEHIILMGDGYIEAQGSFDEVLESGKEFAQLMKEIKQCGDMLEDDKPSTSVTTPAGSNIPKKISRQFMMGLSASGASLSEKIKTRPPQEVEVHSHGRVKGQIYSNYFRAGVKWPLIVILIMLFLIAQASVSGTDCWLTYWVNTEVHYRMTGDRDMDTHTCIMIYAALNLTIIISSLTRSFMFFWVCVKASVKLHDDMFLSISRATMRFFNTNPSGRILNRFSKDMGAVDELLPYAMMDTVQLSFNMLGVLAVVAVVEPTLLGPLVVILIGFWLMRSMYARTSTSIKRLEGITRSPVFSHLNASIQGLPTIRSFHMERRLSDEFDSHQDLHSSSWYLFIGISRAFGYWLDLGCVLFVACVTFSFLLSSTEYSDSKAGAAGLAITQCISLTGVFQWGMRQSAEMETQMTSVERILEYKNIDHEGALKSAPGTEPPHDWPKTGKVEFCDVSLSYSPTAKPVLRNLSFVVPARTKMGIVGRTGAGKSSIIAALFRMAPLDGEILIDNLATSTMGLHDLRRVISIIPQEPVLFSGTIRKNLDPFEEHSDAELFTALREVELLEVARPEIGGLNHNLSDGGGNLSIGQRQLVCLARALVRGNRILVLDEATANVDAKTDFLIQTAIQTHFKECTVFTIAHRLHTVMSCDKILVMDAGRVVEYESPWRLLQSPDSFLSILVRQTGPEMAAVLIAMARKASDDDPSAPTAQDIQQSYTTADDQKTERSSTSSRSVERSDIVGIPGRDPPDQGPKNGAIEESAEVSSSGQDQTDNPENENNNTRNQ